MSETGTGETDRLAEVSIDPASDLLAATPETAYFWGRVAGDGDVTAAGITTRASDETAAAALSAIAGAGRTGTTHRVASRPSAHDASVVRFEDEYEIQVIGAPAERASAAFGLPIDGQPGGYRFDAFAEHRPQLLRGLVEACGTICFRESSASVGISFVHDDRALLTTIRSQLAASEPHVPTDDLAEASSGGYWFGLAETAAVADFADWLYAGSELSDLYAADRRAKLRRSVERATDSDVGTLGDA